MSDRASHGAGSNMAVWALLFTPAIYAGGGDGVGWAAGGAPHRTFTGAKSGQNAVWLSAAAHSMAWLSVCIACGDLGINIPAGRSRAARRGVYAAWRLPPSSGVGRRRGVGDLVGPVLLLMIPANNPPGR